MDYLLSGLAIALTAALTGVIVKRLGKWEGAGAGEPLTPEQVDELRPRIDRLDRVAKWVAVASTGLGAGAAGFILIAIHNGLVPPRMGTVVLDDRVACYICVLCASLAVGVLAMVVATRLVVRVCMGGDVSLHDRYEVANIGKNPARQARALGVVFAAVAALFVLCSFGVRERIDEGGIVFAKSPFDIQHRSFDQVARIELFDRVDAPAGIFKQASLRLTFLDGDLMDVTIGKGHSGKPRLAEIAEFVSRRSGQPVLSRDLRPPKDEAAPLARD